MVSGMSETPATYQAKLPVMEKYKDIYALEDMLVDYPQLEFPLRHQLCNGLYARTILMPKGSLVISQLHRDESFLVMLSGECEITTDDGVILLTAGEMFITRAFAKRALYMHTDVLLVTIHPNPDNESDVEKLWARYIVPRNEINEINETKELLA